MTATLAASSAVRLPGVTTRRGVGWAVAFSILLHVALLMLAIVAAQHRRLVPQSVPPATVALVFENGGKTPPSLANPAPVAPGQQASPAPQPSTPPPPPPAPPVTQEPQPVAPAPTAPPVETPPPQQEVPPPPLPAPPTPLPQAAPQPPPVVSAPSSPAPAAQAPAEQVLPPPPPAPAASPPPAPPRPPQAVRPTPAPRPGPAFPAPMDFSLGPRVAVPHPAPLQPRSSPGTIDMSFAPMMGGGDITQLHPEGKGEDVGADWFSLVEAWWMRHRFYPNEAGRLEQQGDVTLRLVVDHDGQVQAANVVQRSGSPWLDLGALAVFRDAKLPALPGDFHDPDITVQFTIHYIIVR